MRGRRTAAVVGATALFLAGQTAAWAGQTPGRLEPDPPIHCDSCDEWNKPRAPFKVFGTTYFVGSDGLSAMLITSAAGHILLDGGLSQTAPLIDANILALGFRLQDVKLIVNSHGHYDHAAGIAALQRASGAEVAASPSSADALRRGGATPDDPQIGFGVKENAFPAVRNVRAIADGEVLRVGDAAITAHFTPGHTPGSTAWTWTACEGPRCLNIVYADSLTPVAAPGFRYTGDATTPSRVALFRKSIATVAALPCDIVISTHPSSTGLDRKLARRHEGTWPDALVDPSACRTLAATATAQLDARVAEEAKLSGGRRQ